jgi:hypothetical protein
MPVELRLIFDETSENRLIAHLNEFPDTLAKALAEPIRRITDAMLSHVIAAEPVRTGALHDATKAFTDFRDNLIRGRVRILAGGPGLSHAKAAALEYGAHGPAHVAAHSMRLDHVFDEEIPPEDVMVSGYTRDVNITERRFLRDALAAEIAEFEIEVQKAITELAGSFLLGVAQ